MGVQMRVVEELNERMIGKVVTVLCEDYDVVSEAYYGRSASDAPDIDTKIYFTSDKRIAPGAFVKVRVKEVVDYDLFGKAVG